MTDLEFDILDELYFVTPFDALHRTLGMDAVALKEALQSLIDKGWVKCFYSSTVEVVTEKVNFDEEYLHYQYLATKAGLLAHNSR